MATTVFDVICLATCSTKHLYHAYSGCIRFKSLCPCRRDITITYTILCRLIKGAAWRHIWHVHCAAATTGVYIWQFKTAAQRNGNFGGVLANSLQSSLGEPLLALYRSSVLYSLLAQQPKYHTNFRTAIQCLLGVLNHTRLDRCYCFPAASHYPDGCRQ